MGGITFRPELAAAVMAGTKTVTRRLCVDNPHSPWWRYRCALVPGREYAVQPGRGRKAIGRAVVVTVERQALGTLDDAEAQREGFPDREAFEAAWAAINGRYDPWVLVWRVELRVVRDAPPDGPCPNAANHTPHPTGYIAHSNWADDALTVADQRRCPGCGRCEIWVPRRADLRIALDWPPAICDWGGCDEDGVAERFWPEVEVSTTGEIRAGRWLPVCRVHTGLPGGQP